MGEAATDAPITGCIPGAAPSRPTISGAGAFASADGRLPSPTALTPANGTAFGSATATMPVGSDEVAADASGPVDDASIVGPGPAPAAMPVGSDEVAAGASGPAADASIVGPGPAPVADSGCAERPA